MLAHKHITVKWPKFYHALSMPPKFCQRLARFQPTSRRNSAWRIVSGDSTLGLAARHPDAVLLGLDRSAHRLARLAPDGFAAHGRTTLMRAEAATLLRLLAADGLRIDVLYLLYPNPWPKPEHLQRRWHGHPVFPHLLGSARRVVLRTNWRTYAEEFAQAMLLLGRAGLVEALAPQAEVLTPFERKYRSSGHARFELVSDDA